MDDVQVYTQVLIDNLFEGPSDLVLIAGRVDSWAGLNHLRLNLPEITAIVFCRSQAMDIFKRPNLRVVTLSNREVVRFENTVKSLGIVLNNTLSWKAQRDPITRKVNRALFGLRFIKPCTTQTLRKR